jgi:hypothetical protein
MMIDQEELLKNERRPTVHKQLSVKDVVLLKALVRSTGKLSSLHLSRKLEIPMTTIQRRRKWLENVFISCNYNLVPEAFGYKVVTIDIGTCKGMTNQVISNMRGIPNVIRLARVLSGGESNLRATTYVRGTPELVAIMERIRQVDGISSISWVEEMEVVAKNDVLDLIFPEDASSTMPVDLEVNITAGDDRTEAV